MCLLKSLYKDDIKEVSPYPPRVDMLDIIQEKLELSEELATKHRREDIRCVAGVAAPTGTGKTTYLVSLAVASTLYEQSKVTIVTPTKEARAEVLARILEVVDKLVSKEEEPPKILIIQSKVDTCISDNPRIMRILEMIAAEEESIEPDTNNINMLIRNFYYECSHLRRNGLCPFYERATYPGIAREVVNEVFDEGTYVAGIANDETVKIIEREAPSIAKQIRRDGTIPYFKDVKQIASEHGLCPYELFKLLVEEADVLVVDGTYLSMLFTASKNPIVTEAFSPERLVLVDETHELFRNLYPRINVSAFTKIGPMRRFAETIERIIREHGVPEASIDANGTSVRVAVPPEKLESRYVNELLHYLEETEELLKHGKMRLSLKASIRVLKEALNAELRGARVSEGAKPGILAFMKLSEGGRTEYFVIPVMMSRRLLHGRDFDTVVHFSATLLPTHLSLLHTAPASVVSQLIAPVKWGVIERNRRTAIVKAPSYLRNRSEIADVVEELIKASGKEKVLVVATRTWRDFLHAVAKELDYSYYTPKAVRTQREREKEANHIKNMIHSPGKLLLHISPHTSFGVAVNLADKNKPLDILVIGASEAIMPPSSEANAEAAVIARKYGTSWYTAWFTVNVNRAILKVIQTVGRVQRSGKHKADVVLIGKYFDRSLARFYEQVFGKYDIIYRGDVDAGKIVEAVKEYMGW